MTPDPGLPGNVSLVIGLQDIEHTNDNAAMHDLMVMHLEATASDLDATDHEVNALTADYVVYHDN